MGLGALVGLTAGGTALQVASTLKEGKQAEQIANARADVHGTAVGLGLNIAILNCIPDGAD